MEVLEDKFFILGTSYKAMESSRKTGSWMCVREMRLSFLVRLVERERDWGWSPSWPTSLSCHACLPRIQPPTEATGDWEPEEGQAGAAVEGWGRTGWRSVWPQNLKLTTWAAGHALFICMCVEL